MLTSLSRMVGLPVVWQDQQLGYVERALPDAAAHGLSGVVVRKGIGSAKWAPSDFISVVGSQCVLLNRKPGAMPDRERDAAIRAYLTTGECVGEVTDAVLHGGTLRMAALEISPGPLYRLMGRRSYAADYRLNVTGGAGAVVVPRLLTWAQLRCMLGEEEKG